MSMSSGPNTGGSALGKTTIDRTINLKASVGYAENAKITDAVHGRLLEGGVPSDSVAAQVTAASFTQKVSGVESLLEPDKKNKSWPLIPTPIKYLVSTSRNTFKRVVFEGAASLVKQVEGIELDENGGKVLAAMKLLGDFNNMSREARGRMGSLIGA